ncbi:MAG: Fic family protein [Patescibacteria group bacterium]
MKYKHLEKTSEIDRKLQRLLQQVPYGAKYLAGLMDWFSIELTYTSNALEGNTLTRAETALVIENGLTTAGKTIREHLEAINHAQAFEFIKNKVDQSTQEHKNLDEDDILKAHRLILQKIDDQNAGRYRNVPVRISGSRVVMPNAAKIPDLMSELVADFGKSKQHVVTQAVDFHLRLVSIHPFLDGNGRVARLMMNFWLMMYGYPPLIVSKEVRRQYLSSIEKVQLGGSSADYYNLMYQAMNYSLDICLENSQQQEKLRQLNKKSLLKIGDFANLSSETVPTIRYWTKQGLIDVDDYSRGGYQLYSPSAIKRTKKIRQLQKN